MYWNVSKFSLRASLEHHTEGWLALGGTVSDPTAMQEWDEEEEGMKRRRRRRMKRDGKMDDGAA